MYRVRGIALFSPERIRVWQPFTIDVRAMKKEDAIEKVYSDLGSKHKLRRAHIKVIDVSEISPEMSKYKYIKDVSNLTSW